MKDLPTLSPPPSNKAEIIGLVYWSLSFALLGSLIYLVATLMGFAITDIQLNMIYYAINAAAAILIFRQFLAANWKIARNRIFPTVYYAILAFLGSQLLTNLVTTVVFQIHPNFTNVNDDAIHAMLAEEPELMVIGTVILAPIAEEIFYRGMIFRKLFDIRPWLGYAASMAIFAVIHMVGYIGTYPMDLLILALLQYLPAGYCLCWCYRQTGTIFSPILMHMIFNGVSIYSLVR